MVAAVSLALRENSNFVSFLATWIPSDQPLLPYNHSRSMVQGPSCFSHYRVAAFQNVRLFSGVQWIWELERLWLNLKAHSVTLFFVIYTFLSILISLVLSDTWKLTCLTADLAFKSLYIIDERSNFSPVKGIWFIMMQFPECPFEAPSHFLLYVFLSLWPLTKIAASCIGRAYHMLKLYSDTCSYISCFNMNMCLKWFELHSLHSHHWWQGWVWQGISHLNWDYPYIMPSLKVLMSISESDHKHLTNVHLLINSM